MTRSFERASKSCLSRFAAAASAFCSLTCCSRMASTPSNTSTDSLYSATAARLPSASAASREGTSGPTRAATSVADAVADRDSASARIASCLLSGFAAQYACESFVASSNALRIARDTSVSASRVDAAATAPSRDNSFPPHLGSRARRRSPPRRRRDGTRRRRARSCPAPSPTPRRSRRDCRAGAAGRSRRPSLCRAERGNLFTSLRCHDDFSEPFFSEAPTEGTGPCSTVLSSSQRGAAVGTFAAMSSRGPRRPALRGPQRAVAAAFVALCLLPTCSSREAHDTAPTALKDVGSAKQGEIRARSTPSRRSSRRGRLRPTSRFEPRGTRRAARWRRPRTRPPRNRRPTPTPRR